VKDGTTTTYPLAYQIVFGVFNMNIPLPNPNQSVIYTDNGIDIQTSLRDGYTYQNLGDITYVNDGTEWNQVLNQKTYLDNAKYFVSVEELNKAYKVLVETGYSHANVEKERQKI